MEKVLCVTGPTACGKTALGVALARRFDGEVVSADSMQIYRGMTIGSAAPTEAEMGGVPHHMVAVADPREKWSAARYVSGADACVRDILSRGKLPVIVGGTGLWMESLVRGYVFAAGSAGGDTRAALYRELEEKGPAALRDELERVDPVSAGKIPASDVRRILRALEVYRETGETIAEHDRRSGAAPPKYEALWIGLAYRDRADQRSAVDRRVDRMLSAGLLDEVRALAALDLPEDATALQAIGYKELFPVLRGERDLREAAGEVKLRSRQYAKRQLTWLRRNRDIHWIYREKEQDLTAELQDATGFLMDKGLQ